MKIHYFFQKLYFHFIAYGYIIVAEIISVVEALICLQIQNQIIDERIVFIYLLFTKATRETHHEFPCIRHGLGRNAF